MSKIKTTKWPTRNPYGDNLMYKARTVTGTAWTLATGNAQVIAVSGKLNSLRDTWDRFGATPGFTALTEEFHNYRVSGVRYKITIWPIKNDEAVSEDDYPCCIYIQISPDNTFVTPNVSNLPEQRWARYRVITAANRGAKPTTLKAYFSTNKCYGPDMVVKNDFDFIGSTDPSQTTYQKFTTPAKGPDFQMGVFTLAGTAPTVDLVFHVKIEVTTYTKFFSKRELVA